MIDYLTAENKTITATQARFATMGPGQTYALVSDTDCYFRIGTSAVTAVAAAADNHLLVAGQVRLVCIQDATNRGFISVIRKSADGVATLSLVDGIS